MIPDESVTQPDPGARRRRDIDLLRGVVMILMVLDHVRVYAGVPPGGDSPALFFTRWVTHFCAPVFIFLAGMSIWLRGARGGGLGRYLLVRGAALVALELTVIRVAWTFNLGFDRYLLGGVIWVIGLAMMIMAVVVRLPVRAVAILAAVIVGGHNLLPSVAPQAPSWWWTILYAGPSAGPVMLWEGGPAFHVLYALLPWVGVMAGGYAVGALLPGEPERRRRAVRIAGGTALVLFLVLRAIDGYGDPAPWRVHLASAGASMPPILAFLNTSKYPASLLFLLMTLGPALLVLPALERARGARWDAVATFGRTPLLFYLMHIPLIHLLALGVSRLRSGAVDPWLFADHPMGAPWPPPGYAWSLGAVYLMSGIVVAMLYLPCRWAETPSRLGTDPASNR